MLTEITADVRANKGVIISRNERRIGKSIRRIRYNSIAINKSKAGNYAGTGRKQDLHWQSGKSWLKKKWTVAEKRQKFYISLWNLKVRKLSIEPIYRFLMSICVQANREEKKQKSNGKEEENEEAFRQQ